MVVIFSRVLIGWVERRLWLIEAPGLVAFMRKTKRIGNNRRREAGREIDFSATISDPLNFTHPFHSWSASPHTPASLRDISCAQRGDKTHCLSVGPCIHLVPIAAPWTPYLRKWLFIGRRSLLFLLSGVSSRSKVKGNALTEREKQEIILESASKHSLPPLQKHSICSNRRCYTRDSSALSKNTGTIVLQS